VAAVFAAVSRSLDQFQSEFPEFIARVAALRRIARSVDLPPRRGHGRFLHPVQSFFMDGKDYLRQWANYLAERWQEE